MATIPTLTVVPIPGVSLRVDGDAAAIDHLAAEYAAAGASAVAARETVASLHVTFVSKLPGVPRNGHKTIHWAAAMEWTAPHRLLLRIALQGHPRWFGLSLVQGYLIEPALSLLAVPAGGVLLPAAAIVKDGGTLLLIGRSGTGKSSLSLRALAAGLPLLGDDQVFVARDGTCTRFPRRLRLYDDAARTAPEAISLLPWRARMGLGIRKAVRVSTRGYVAPSMAVPLDSLSRTPGPPSAALGRVALLSRAAGGSGMVVRPSDGAEAVVRCHDVLADQRRRLARALGGGWPDEIARVAGEEDSLLATVLTATPVTAIDMPTDLDAARAIDALAAELRIP